MNRTDAAAILSIDASASADEARKAYQELFTEHQMRLTNAPTPALRNLYQARLRELDEARDVLLAPPPDDANSDLPTDQPSIPDRAEPERPRTAAPPPVTPPPVTSTPEKKTAPAPRVAPPATPATERPAPAAAKSNRKIQIGVGIVGTIIVVLGLVQVFSKGSSSGSTTADSTAAVTLTDNPAYADSMRAVKENMSMARVEMNRGEPDYASALKSLDDAAKTFAGLPAPAPSDTAAVALKERITQQRAAVLKACLASKRVAEQRGDPLPNCGS
jgi:pyruvate/2-oxoglutarate dehydrogenase complex dihydrolipoamide acyltransferase (E2) component